MEEIVTQPEPPDAETSDAATEPDQPGAEPEPATLEAEPDGEPEPEAESEQAGEFEPAAIAMLPPVETAAPEVSDIDLQAVIEAVVYVAEEPLTLAQLANALSQPAERVETILRQLMREFERAEHGIGIREVAGGFKMATKAEHHETVRNFVKSLKPQLKLSLPALETLAVIAYKQPVTGPEIMEIRGVQGLGVIKTLLDRKLIASAGRKNVIGKPILYKTTKEFLIQFGLKDIGELPSLKEFEEIRRMAFGDAEPPPQVETAPETEAAAGETAPEPDAEQAAETAPETEA